MTNDKEIDAFDVNAAFRFDAKNGCVCVCVCLTDTLRGLMRVSLVQLMGPSVSKLVM